MDSLKKECYAIKKECDHEFHSLVKWTEKTIKASGLSLGLQLGAHGDGNDD